MTDFSDAFTQEDGEQRKYFEDVAKESGIQGLFTSCEDCVFASYENKTQTSCKLNRIKKFREKNIEVIEAENEDNEFYVVKSFCNCYRNIEWGDNHADHELSIYNENRIRWSAIIIVGNGKLESEASEKDVSSFLKNLEKTCISIKEQSIPPVIVVVSNNSDMLPFDIAHKAHEMFDRTGIDFYVSNIVEPGLTDLQCIDDSFLKCKNGFYSVFKSGHSLKPDLFESLNSVINNELEKVAFIRGYDGINGTTVQAAMHKYLGGNFSMSVEEKIVKICSEDGSSSLIRDWKELYEFS
jgi:hypothetical protein